MLAETVEVDVAHDHHLVILDGEERAVDDLVEVGVVSAREELHRLGDAARRLAQPLAIRILAEFFQQTTDRVLHGGIVPPGCGARRAGTESGPVVSAARDPGEGAPGRRRRGRAGGTGKRLRGRLETW